MALFHRDAGKFIISRVILRVRSTTRGVRVLAISPPSATIQPRRTGGRCRGGIPPGIRRIRTIWSWTRLLVATVSPS